MKKKTIKLSTLYTVEINHQYLKNTPQYWYNMKKKTIKLSTLYTVDYIELVHIFN